MFTVYGREQADSWKGKVSVEPESEKQEHDHEVRRDPRIFLSR